jgi:hypothetical protein
MRVLMFGGRLYRDAQRVEDEVALLDKDDVVVAGGAQGADYLAECAALRRGIRTETHYAQWDKHGKAAGVIRNQEMLDSGIDKAVQFPGGVGTRDMRKRLDKAGVPVKEVTE